VVQMSPRFASGEHCWRHLQAGIRARIGWAYSWRCNTVVG
jgi:hypothetical protein